MECKSSRRVVVVTLDQELYSFNLVAVFKETGIFYFDGFYASCDWSLPVTQQILKHPKLTSQKNWRTVLKTLGGSTATSYHNLTS